MTGTAEDPLALDRQLSFALTVAARDVVALYRPELEPLGLTHPQFLVMLALWERDERSLRDLSDALALDPGTLSPLVKRLEAAGLVRRDRDQADERLLAVTLTAAGHRLRDPAEKIPPRIVDRLGLSTEDLEHLDAVLRTIMSAASGSR